MRILDCADSALLVELEGAGDPVALADAVRRAGFEGAAACIPGLDSVLVEYDCLRTDRAPLRARIEELLGDAGRGVPAEPRHLVLPVCFEASVSPDLDEVGKRAGLTRDAVIAALTGAELRVAMIGHLPGLPYLSGLPAVLDLPRRLSPRSRVDAGSLGVAAGMACVYPSAAPGGWHLVGRSPATLWDAGAEPPALLRAGDRVRLEEVGREALERGSGAMASLGEAG